MLTFPAYILTAFYSLVSTHVEIKVNGKQPKSFSECPISVVTDNKEFELTDSSLVSYLSQVDSFYLRGQDYLAGFKSSTLAGLKPNDDFLKVLINTDVPIDSFGYVTHWPKKGYVMIQLEAKNEVFKRYFVHSGRQYYSSTRVILLGPSIKKDKRKKKN